MKKLVLAVFAAALLSGPAAVFAADEVDMGKISCKEFLDDKDNIGNMLYWIDGYMMKSFFKKLTPEENEEYLKDHPVPDEADPS